MIKHFVQTGTIIKRYRFNKRGFFKKADKVYFGMKLGDKDESWALHIVFKYCTKTFRF